MDLETTNTEVTDTQTTEVVETAPATTTDTTEVSASPTTSVTEAITSAAAGVPAWMPEFKFKVKDKELEFDDFVKPIIKSKEVNDKIKDLYLKAHGLDEVKQSRDHFQNQYKAENEKITTIEKNLQNIGVTVKNKDFGTFFDLLKIDKNDVMNYFIEELKFQELPAEQKQAIERQRQVEREYQTAQEQNQGLQTQMQEMMIKQTKFEFAQVFASPDVAPAIQQFEARVGQPGAFEKAILERGQYYEAVHKTSPPVRQLVNEVLTLAGLSSGMPGQAQQAPLTQQSNASQVVHAQNQKPVIPSFSGGSSTKSPARQVVGTIDDIRKRRQELLQNQS